MHRFDYPNFIIFHIFSYFLKSLTWKNNCNRWTLCLCYEPSFYVLSYKCNN